MYLERFLGVTLDSVARRLARTYSTTNRGESRAASATRFRGHIFYAAARKDMRVVLHLFVTD